MSQTELNIIIIDDEPNIRKTLLLYFETQGHYCTTVSNISDALASIEQRRFDLALLDLRLGTDNGLDLIPQMLKNNPNLKIVIMTAYASIDSAVKAMQLGAVDYIPKPFHPEQLSAVLLRSLALKKMERKIESLQEDLGRMQPEAYFSSNSPSMQRIFDMAKQVAGSDATILIEGPSGTGKTVLAKMIHQWSSRADKPFGVISCPMLSPELLESELFGHTKGAFTGAHRDNAGKVAACEGGTLFLDEVGDLPTVIQGKLLRFIQEREYERVGDHKPHKANVRIIAATNTNLETAVKEARFREDLFFRLSVIVFKIPPLCERREDILPLAESLLTFFSAQNHKSITGFAPAVIKEFTEYSWPGNLRELRNVIERMAILCNSNIIGAEWLPETMKASTNRIQVGDQISLAALERAHIQKILLSAKTLQEASDILGIDQATLWRKRKQFGLD